VTRRAYRRFRFGIFALCWLGAAALQTYVSDVGTHGVIVGAYLPGWLLAVAAIPPLAVLGVAVLDALVALAAPRLPDALLPVLAILNSVFLVAYAFIGVAVIFYIAFANNGIS
jgi:hypothetical protein